MAISLYPHQKRAVGLWLDNNMRGVISMATGTGKTFTALACTEEFFKHMGKGFVIILVPFTHLVGQWKSAIEKYGLDVDKVVTNKDAIKAARYVSLGWYSKAIAITTYKWFVSWGDDLLYYLSPTTPSMLVADESHRFGSDGMKKLKGLDKFHATLGISATPQRAFDESGNAFISAFLGDVIYTYDLRDALADDVIVPYHYYVYASFMNDDEWETFQNYTRGIAAKLSQDEEDDAALLAIRRALTMISVKDKLNVLRQIISHHNISHTIIFTSYLLFADTQKVLAEHGIAYETITGDDSQKRRQQKISRFMNKEVDVLVAMKVLDEGVDIPQARRAIFLASPSSHRIVTQRIGRVTRKHAGKSVATIWDTITLPPSYVSGDYVDKLLSLQMPRVDRLASEAVGGFSEYLNVVEKIEHLFGR